VKNIGDALLVNPALLLDAVSEAFQTQCANMSPGRNKLLAENLRHHFRAEARAARE
jgi:hypothetical protein